jgi:hypothetical protein
VTERILDRLSKLLAMRDGGTEAEAEVAALRAAELMARYQLTEADVPRPRADKPGVESGRIDDEEGAPLARFSQWRKQLGIAVANVFGARMYTWVEGRTKYMSMRMVGPRDSVNTARYMYMALEKEVGRQARAAMRRHGEDSSSWRRNYALSMVLRIGERLKEGRATAMQTATETALVWVDMQKQAIDEECNKLGLRTSRPRGGDRPDARRVGYRDGANVDIGDASRDRLTEGQRKLGGG